MSINFSKVIDLNELPQSPRMMLLMTESIWDNMDKKGKLEGANALKSDLERMKSPEWVKEKEIDLAGHAKEMALMTKANEHMFDTIAKEYGANAG